MMITVILPAHNPHSGRLHRVLTALCGQSLPAADWECLLVDNASNPALQLADWRELGLASLRLISEPTPGLSHARRCGFAEARGEFVVLVDDDNVLAPDYLAQALALFKAHPEVGALGGRSVAEFERSPAAWWRPAFDGLLACRDLGAAPLIATGAKAYPICAPIGAGMALRREAALAWLVDDAAGQLPDRRNTELTSGGDNDIVLTTLRHGWAVGYFPELVLTHLIPTERTTRDYLARLNRGIAKSWPQVLHRHGLNPWTAIAPWTVPLRQGKSWFGYRAWAGPAEFIRWQGACGHFEGRASLSRRVAPPARGPAPKHP